MLRFLGIPARVAAGFTSGSYDKGRRSGWSPTTTRTTGSRSGSRAWAGSRSTRRPDEGSSTRATRRTRRAFSRATRPRPRDVPRRRRRVNPQSPSASAARRSRAGRAWSAGGHRQLGRRRRRCGVVRDKGPSLVVLVLLVLAAAAFAVSVLLKAVLPHAPLRGRAPSRACGRLPARRVGYLADQGLEVPPSATLGEIGRARGPLLRSGRRPVRRRAATLARFGPPDRGPRRARSPRAAASSARCAGSSAAASARSQPRPRRASLRSLARLSSPLHAVVMAAGEGRRLRPLTERWPKPILPIDGQPVIATLLRELAGAGIARATVVTGHLAGQVEALVGDGSAFGSRVRLRAPAGAARLGRRRPARARGGSRAAAPRRRRPTRCTGRGDCRPRGRGVARLGRCRRAWASAAAAARGRRRCGSRPGSSTAIGGDRGALTGGTALVLRRRAPARGSRTSPARRSSCAAAFRDAAGTGIEILALDVGPTRDLTRPEDVVLENFPYLWRSG